MRKKLQREILLNEVLVTLLKKYRYWILLCIVCIVTVFLYLQVVVLPSVIVNVNENEKEHVREYMEILQLAEDAETYNDNSLLMACNPHEAYIWTFELAINSLELTTEQWNLCLNLKQSEWVQNRLKDTFQTEDIRYLEELIQCEDISEQAVGNEKVLRMQIIYPDDEEYRQLNGIVTDYFNIVFSTSVFELRELRNEECMIYSQELAQWQQNQSTLLQAYTSAASKKWSSLTETEQLLYHQSPNGELVDSITIYNNTVNQFEYYMLAIVISFLLFACYEIVRLSWSGKIQNEYALEYVSELEILFDVRNKKRNTVIDRFIEKLEDKIMRNDFLRLTDKECMEQLKHYKEASKQTVMIAMDQKTEKKLQVICTELLSEHSKLQLFPYERKMKLDHWDQIIFVLSQNESYYEDIYDLKEKCQNEHMILLGMIFFQ